MRLNAAGEIRIRLFSRQESAIDFVADGAENAGHRGALSVAPREISHSGSCGDIHNGVNYHTTHASYGAVLATFSLIQSIRRERRSIVIDHMIQRFSSDETHYDPFLVITLVNRGCRPVVVLLPILLLNEKDELELLLSDDAKEFPKKLEDGDVAIVRVSGKYLTALIKDAEYTGTVKAQIICFDSTGKRYSSKKWTLEA